MATVEVLKKGSLVGVSYATGHAQQDGHKALVYSPQAEIPILQAVVSGHPCPETRRVMLQDNGVPK